MLLGDPAHTVNGRAFHKPRIGIRDAFCSGESHDVTRTTHVSGIKKKLIKGKKKYIYI